MLNDPFCRGGSWPGAAKPCFRTWLQNMVLASFSMFQHVSASVELKEKHSSEPGKNRWTIHMRITSYAPNCLHLPCDFGK